MGRNGQRLRMDYLPVALVSVGAERPPLRARDGDADVAEVEGLRPGAARVPKLGAGELCRVEGDAEGPPGRGGGGGGGRGGGGGGLAGGMLLRRRRRRRGGGSGGGGALWG